MNKQDNGTGTVHQLRPVNATKIEPLDGWEVHTKYGTLRLRDGTDFVRLQDVHSWFLRDGKPASEVNWMMFAPLLDAARVACDGVLDAAGELAACKLLGSLRLVCATERPVQIFGGKKSCGVDPDENKKLVQARTLGDEAFVDAWIERYVPSLTFMRSDHVKLFRSNFPALGHHRFEDDTPAGLIFGMAEGVVRVWRGPVDAATDPVLMASIKKDRAEEGEYHIEWPSDDVLSLALERVAVPIAIAHELWGWGRAVTVEAETKAAPAGESEAGKQTHNVWTPEKRQKLLDEFNKAGGKLQKEKLSQVAKKWSLSLHNASKQIKLARKAKKTNYATGLGGRKSTR